MKKSISLFVIASLIFGCKKADNSTTTPVASKLSQSYTFDNSQTMASWIIQGGGGSASIDTITKKTGTGSLHLKQSNSLCAFFNLKNGISVIAGHSYTISFDGKCPNETVPSDTVGGGCAYAGGVGVTVYMANEYSPISTIDVYNTDWNNFSATFKADSSGKPLFIKFYIGARDSWFDNLSLKEN